MKIPTLHPAATAGKVQALHSASSPERRERTRTSARLAIVVLGLLTLVPPAFAANIVWVSDANDPAANANTFSGFFPAGSGYTDSAFVTLLQNAGHNVIRYNQPNAQGTLLSAEHIAAFNTNDLIIIGRCVNSGAFQPPQGEQWNTNITKPLIATSPFHTRTEGPNRLGWLLGNTSDNFDDTPTVLSAVLPSDPAQAAVVDYLFGGVAMNGTNTVSVYDESLDRNTSQIAGAPVPGGIVYAAARYEQQNNTATPPTMNSGNVIVGLPAGTAVRYGTNILAGYRMFFACGSRESSLTPNGISTYAGRETLTPAGENIFLRAVEIALNNGVAPATDPNAPVGFAVQPASTTVLQGRSVTLSVTVTGAAPRTVQWQRGTGDGVTFTNIPDASTPFSISTHTLPAVSLEDDGAQFRVEASNGPGGTVYSEVAVLTVTPDTAPPVALSAASFEGTTVGVCFDELLDNVEGTPTETFNYVLNNNLGPFVTTAVLQPDGQSVLLTLDGPLDASFTLNIASVKDRHGNAITGLDLAGTNYALATANVGPPNPVLTNSVCGTDSLQLTAGGTNLLAGHDQLGFAYRTVDGDFDARVRVTSLVGLGRHESFAKAMLVARESTDANAANVCVFVTPPAPADNSVGVTVRTNTGGLTGNLAPATAPNGLPNAWLRLVRLGNVFSTFRSDNGVDWVQLGGNITLNYPSTLLVGLGVNAHRNGRATTATFGNFRIGRPVYRPMLTNSTHDGTTFSASFASQADVNYEVQYRDTLPGTPWLVLTNIAGDDAVKTFTDPAPPTPSRYYRIVVP